MNPIKEQLSQLVQDVFDGNESAVKAHEIFLDVAKHLMVCGFEIETLVKIELDADNQDHNIT